MNHLSIHPDIHGEQHHDLASTIRIGDPGSTDEKH